LHNFIAEFTNPAAVLLTTIGVAIRAYGPPAPLGSSRQQQSYRIFHLWSGKPAIAAFTIDKMMGSTIPVTIGSPDSLSTARCHQNSRVIFSTTIFPAMTGFK
jgi:hypothetical protein